VVIVILFVFSSICPACPFISETMGTDCYPTHWTYIYSKQIVDQNLFTGEQVNGGDVEMWKYGNSKMWECKNAGK
jgi:hypothetical protein